MREGAAARAFQAVERSPYFLGWAGEPRVLDSKVITADFLLQVEMPSTWAEVGVSPNGVRLIEPVSIELSDHYPAAAPVFRLRDDFPRTFPHIQPGRSDQAPRPCLVAGSEQNLFWRKGIPGMLDQLASWLHRAARDSLEDKLHWEPARRDHVDDLAFVELAFLQSLPTGRHDLAYVPIEYAAFFGKRRDRRNRLFFGSQTCQLGRDFQKSIRQGKQDNQLAGTSLAIVLTPKWASGGRPIISAFLPDDVSDLDSLRASLRYWDCLDAFNASFAAVQGEFLKLRAPPGNAVEPIPLAIAINLPRPRVLLGTSSSIETLIYVIHVEVGKAVATNAPVRLAAALENLNISILRRFNQEKPDEQTQAWSLVGAGSLGSKIALHMGRAGRAPAAVIDPECFDAHNSARHAVVPPDVDKDQTVLSRMKAWEVASQMRALKQTARFMPWAVEEIMSAQLHSQQLKECSRWLLLNTTASPWVRQILVQAGNQFERTAESCLFGEGKVGYFAVEGAGRNPDGAELFQAMTAGVEENPALAELLVSEQSALQTIQTGVGCGSETMAVTDAELSGMAAAMSSELQRLHRDGLGTDGSLLVGQRADDGLSIQWSRTMVPVFDRVPLDRNTSDPWAVHLSSTAQTKIAAEVARYPNVETGGVLWGKIDEAMGRIYVMDVIPAPPDSKRSPSLFVLGTEGLREALQNRSRRSHGYFYDVGTWHSHLHPSGPSSKDRDTASLIAAQSDYPQALLIWTPTGYRGLLAEPLDTVVGRPHSTDSSKE